ncbi:MAG: MmgE/PrpD family protein [Chloroflexi bacterium]|nr:MmgE/PrpD family protein [Chloroflexota bacterium]
MGITSEVAGFVLRTTYDDLPPQVVHLSKAMMLNSAGIGLAASVLKEGTIITQYVQDAGGTPECTVLGKAFKSSAAHAALANGTMMHALDYDEAVLRRGCHPSNSLFPTVLALGERLGSSGKEVLGAFAVGCEVATKVAAAGSLDEPESKLRESAWHGGPVGGVMGAAVAAGKLLGLSQEQMEVALGIATSTASGVRANYGTATKPLDQGRAAMNGIMAALLAQRGFTAARDAIEHPNGFLACFFRDAPVKEEEFIPFLGKPYDVISPGVAFKLYPCGSGLHPSIDAVLHLVHQHDLSPEDVEEVQVGIAPRSQGLLSFARPRTGLEGKFSMNFCVALAILYRRLLISHFTDELVRDPHLVALGEKVTVSVSERSTVQVSRPSTATIITKDGRRLVHRVEHARGHPENPAKWVDLVEKYRYCSQGVIANQKVEMSIQLFGTLERLPDVRQLAALLAGHPGLGHTGPSD